MKKLKAVFCSINSKYIHSTLGVWYLYASAKKLCSENVELSVVEGTINEKEEILLGRLRAENADVIAFSTYIWNRHSFVAPRGCRSERCWERGCHPLGLYPLPSWRL